jgi:hypothetical protein
MGNMAASPCAMADEIQKEHLLRPTPSRTSRSPAYTSLIAMADAAGHANHIPALERTLGEERKMAQAVHDLIEPTTRRFIKLSEEGRKADR